ncbi:DNA cytosine methyltransferase [Dawidia soli]|uniref:Cytosine-specific methyltransferase n=1 Tax=Dawidia soli TaxID=2782352 RepID=A0AAP2DBL5_9BACT|nr:DNA cytosine methyltransferase [Dawidia soli]MBT1688106.1 DNA cytosine methyltransferase [Dawidia soli]
MIKRTFIDLFSGCGGFSLGAHLAGFHNALSVDIDPILTSSYRLNFPTSNLQIADLKQVEDIRVMMKNPPAKPDLLIGGPPCQGFSHMGKRDAEDPRNELIWHFFRHVRKATPNVFIMENVDGLATSEYGRKIVEEAILQLPSYYKTSGIINVNAADFGAATARPRVLIVGFDSRYVDDPRLEEKIKPVKKRTTVWDAISDLPGPVNTAEVNEFVWTKYTYRGDISKYAKALRVAPLKNLGWSQAVDRFNAGQITGLNATTHTSDVKDRFKLTKQGEVEPISRYFKLSWDLPSRTIRAGTGRDKGGFQAARPIHPSQSRVITIREAARIQGFPDWFVFHPTKWHSFRMIGNSVSPVMAKRIIKSL